jgi:ribosomal protein S18 acetylase RimI-like enzyme
LIAYRPFHNSDPPKLVALWHSCQLGRGAADGISCDVFETANFSQRIFDPNGLIVACDGPNVVGFIHAGFGADFDSEEKKLAPNPGVICIVMVHPEYRNRGIGRELVNRAEAYLKDAGSREIFAGSAEPLDPFYVGIYGGVQPAGFLESDPGAAPFFQALGYEPGERHRLYQRDISGKDEPVNYRLMTVRRKMNLTVTNNTKQMTWWWLTRFGDLDSLGFLLSPKAGGPAVASITAVGMDFYLAKYQERVVGLTQLFVPETERRRGYAQTLILNVCRRLRDELVTRVEMHSPESNEAAVKLLESCGFDHVDTGVVYRKLAE